MMIKRILFACLALATFSACQQEPEDLTLYDELVVKTSVKQNADFSEYQSYTIATDTIGFFTNVDPDDTIRVYSSDFKYPRLVLDAVNENMDNRFERKGLDENPDLGVNVYVVSGFNVYQQVVMPSVYDYYYYGYYGSYYYPYVATYVDNRATLFVEIVDLKNRTDDGRVNVLWSAMMGDVINSVDFEKQSVDAIHEAFAQSPYVFEQ